MNVRFERSFYQKPEGDGGSGGGGAVPPADAPAPAPAPAASAPPPAAPAPAPAADDKAGYWPQDWRTKVAGEDAETAKQLTRYASPEAIWHKARELEKKLSSGALKPVLTKDATAEDIASYRKAHGIPEAPDKYDLADLKVEVQDKEFLGEILKAAHETHQKPEQIKQVVAKFFELAQKSRENAAEHDAITAKKAEDDLRLEWGADYRRHSNLINGLLDLTGDQKLNESFMNGRLEDGTKIKDSPAMQKFLLQLALINNPTGVVVPSANGSQMQGLEDEIARIEKVMKTDRKAYNADPGMQKKLRDMYEARETMKARAK
jgi:hypothetical protein